MNLIDRDALMKKICGNECGSVCDEECELAVCHFHDYIMKAPAVNIWIPCSERLPEFDTMVIVCYFGSDMIIPRHGETLEKAIERIRKIPTVTLGMYDEEGWCGADFFPMMVQPAFWMPLPDAPLPEPPEKE